MPLVSVLLVIMAPHARPTIAPLILAAMVVLVLLLSLVIHVLALLVITAPLVLARPIGAPVLRA